MIIAKIIIYTSILIYLVVAIRQYHSSVSLFFIIVGLTDPLTMLIRALVKITPSQMFLSFSILMFFSLCDKKNLRKSIIKTALILTAVIPLSFYIRIEFIRLLLACVQVLVLYKFTKIFSLNVIQKKEINLFFVMLILYTLTLIIKFFILVLKGNTGVMFFYLTSTFELLIGLFYIFFTEDNEKIRFRLTDNH